MHRSIRQQIVYLFRNANCQFMQLIPGVATTTTQSSDHIYYKLYNNNNSNNIIISPRPQKQKIKNKCRDNIARVFCCICVVIVIVVDTLLNGTSETTTATKGKRL